MNHYLVDYENVGPEGMNGIELLNMDSRIYIFYTKNADKLTFNLHIKLNESRAEVFLFKAECGQKNALDFQLSSYLGYLIRGRSDSQNNYFIISKDRGFSPLLPFWKAHGITVSLVADVAGHKIQNTLEELIALVAEQTGDVNNAPAIANIIHASKTKQAVNVALTKAFPSLPHGELYRAIKPLLDDKPGS